VPAAAEYASAVEHLTDASSRDAGRFLESKAAARPSLRPPISSATTKPCAEAADAEMGLRAVICERLSRITTLARVADPARPLAEAQRLINDAKAFDRLVGLQVIRIDGAQATITRPKLIDAFNEIRGYGFSMEKLIDLHERIVPLVDQISEMLVRAGAEHVADRIKPREALPADTEIAELITMLVRFRTQAVASVTATLASSIESTIESLVSRILAEYLERSPDAEVG
jgi:hypothetical protein